MSDIFNQYCQFKIQQFRSDSPRTPELEHIQFQYFLKEQQKLGQSVNNKQKKHNNILKKIIDHVKKAFNKKNKRKITIKIKISS